jgi:hypothetical protein
MNPIKPQIGQEVTIALPGKRAPQTRKVLAVSRGGKHVTVDDENFPNYTRQHGRYVADVGGQWYIATGAIY